MPKRLFERAFPVLGKIMSSNIRKRPGILFVEEEIKILLQIIKTVICAIFFEFLQENAGDGFGESTF